MKKSNIYKYALMATVKDMVINDGVTPDKETIIYEILHEICEKIDLELFNEKQETEKNARAT